jgi:hypothetical protein
VAGIDRGHPDDRCRASQKIMTAAEAHLILVARM